MTLKFYISVAIELKLKVRKFRGLISTFVEATEEKLIGGLFAPSSWIGYIFVNTEVCVTKILFDIKFFPKL